MITNTKLIRHAFIAAIIFALLAGTNVTSVDAAAHPTPAEASINPTELVKAAVAHEVSANNDSSIKHMFRSVKQTPQGSTTRLYVETKEAMAGMTIAYNDKPLSPDQIQGETNRLAALENSPEQLKHKHAQEQENADRTMRIVKALPDAFLFTYDGEAHGNDEYGKNGAPLVRLKFRPNPAYQSPSHTEQVLEGMEGVVMIDLSERRIAQIDGTLFKEVGFGWGILGHLDKGGHFLVEQRDVGNGSWEVSRMSLGFTGKVLLVKTLSIKSDELFTDFHRVPDTTTFAQGVKMLEAERAKQAENHGAMMNAERKSQ